MEKVVRVTLKDESKTSSVGSGGSRGLPALTEERGVGDCPKRADGLGHVWASRHVDELRHCKFCKMPGRSNKLLGTPKGYLDEQCEARSELFAGLRCPDSIRGFKK